MYNKGAEIKRYLNQIIIYVPFKSINTQSKPKKIQCAWKYWLQIHRFKSSWTRLKSGPTQLEQVLPRPGDHFAEVAGPAS